MLLNSSVFVQQKNVLQLAGWAMEWLCAGCWCGCLIMKSIPPTELAVLLTALIVAPPHINARHTKGKFMLLNKPCIFNFHQEMWCIVNLMAC